MKRRYHTRINWDAIEHRLATESASALAKELGCSPGAVRQQRRSREVVVAGAGRGPSEDLVRRVAQRAQEVPVKQVAEEFSISTTMVYSYCRRCGVEHVAGKRGRKPGSTGKRGRTFPGIDLLGTVPDNVLAKRHGVSRQYLQQLRKARGIPRCSTELRYLWEEWNPLLGTMSDVELAKKIGCSSSTVGKRRSDLGIPPFRTIFKEPYDGLLGTMSDREIARQFGVNDRHVRYRRMKLMIAPCKSRRRTLDWDRVRGWFGVKSDGEIGAELGCVPGVVQQYRHRHGIAASRSVTKWNPDWDVLLGTKPDRRLAVELGVSPMPVWSRRKKLGIPACGRKR